MPNGLCRLAGSATRIAEVAISAVCFDLGGVVVRIHGTWDEACAAAGFPDEPPPGWSDPNTVTAWQQAHIAHHRGDVTSLQYFEHVSALSGGYYTSAHVERVHRAWLIEEYPGMAALMQRLEARGVLTACLSNTNDHHWRQMLESDGYPAVRGLRVKLASHVLRLLKPEPAIYTAALGHLRCAPHEVVFFDDLSENVEAARRSGWNAVRIDPKGSPAEQVARALRELDVQL